MGSLGRRRILRARGSTSALIEAAAAAGGEGEDRFASAFGRLDAARRRPRLPIIAAFPWCCFGAFRCVRDALVPVPGTHVLPPAAC